ncbi:MAG: insulinase family protein [Oscillospiraceae bacterium]|nr:insulinase family protein [Oscillospiraceae bacterium]
MIGTLNRKEIGKGAFLSWVAEPKFKHNRITLCLVTPIEKETATVNALVPFVLRKGCKSCPDFTALNKKLAEMYGAILDADVSKHGDKQIIEITLVTADDKFAIGGEKMTETAANLLWDLVFEPNLDEKGLFPEIDLELEREYLIDTIESDLNDKRTYAIGKALDLVFENEPFGIKRYGYVEDAKAITGESLAKAWKNLVKNAKIEVFFAGPGNAETVGKVFAEKISSLEREPFEEKGFETVAYSPFKEAEEEMEIAQGKLVMVFRMGGPKSEREKNAARMLSALYGGTAFSKLFMNVREKMSLCYYADSSFERGSGILIVDCGIEFGNREKAQSEIIRQLELIAEGDFSEEEFSATKNAIMNSLGSVGDTLFSVENWYMGGIIENNVITPEEDKKAMERVTREEVMEMAKRAKLASVFFLKGGEKE